MADELDSTIRENAQGPAEARGDSGSVREHGLKDQVEADKHLAGKDAVAKNPAKVLTAGRGGLPSWARISAVGGSASRRGCPGSPPGGTSSWTVRRGSGR